MFYFSHARSSFCRAANTILSQVGATASEELLVFLLKSKCIPILLYGTEATGLLKREAASLDFVLKRFIIKIFQCTNSQVLDDIYEYMAIFAPSLSAQKREARFLVKFGEIRNKYCLNILSLAR